MDFTMNAAATRTKGRGRARWLLAAVLAWSGSGCDYGDLLGECEPASNQWVINVYSTPMTVVDNTPQIRIGERLSIGVITFDRVFCPDKANITSTRWQFSNPGVVTLTGQPQPNSATIVAAMTGETAVTAQVTFGNGTRTETSFLWAPVGGLRDVIRVVP
jgi:hypothetical protein